MNQHATRQNNAPAQKDIRAEFAALTDQFALALDGHISPERFLRVVLTAVFSDPDLLNADRKSLFEAAMRAAQDQLLPDKREGAFVVFNTKVKTDGQDRRIKAVQWMPMIGGIIKKMHQSGDVSLITARVVYGGDKYRAWIDDEGEHVEYEAAETQDRNTVRQVFAMAKTKDGTVYVEPLTPDEIEKIRNVSRGKDKGPWVGWWEEMAKKSAIRRLSKRLNLSPEIHDLVQRDNAFYDLSLAPDPTPSLAARMAAKRAEQSNQIASMPEGFSPEYVLNATDQYANSGNAGVTLSETGQPVGYGLPADNPTGPYFDEHDVFPGGSNSQPENNSVIDELVAGLAKARSQEDVLALRGKYLSRIQEGGAEVIQQARMAETRRLQEIAGGGQ